MVKTAFDAKDYLDWNDEVQLWYLKPSIDLRNFSWEFDSSKIKRSRWVA
jgi:hypothetical protein